MSRGATRVAGTAVLPVLRGVASGQPWAAAWRTPLRESTTWSRTLATNLNDDREHDRQRRGHPAVLKLGELPAEERAVPCERQWVNPDLWERVKLKRCKEAHDLQQTTAGPETACATAMGTRVGAAVAVLATLDPLLGGTGDSPLLLASFGSSAALLFVGANSPFSQPRAVVGGHALSAAAGVACAQLIAIPYGVEFAAPLAVGLATGCMIKSRTFHPPAAGTAMALATATHGYFAEIGFASVVPISLAATVLVGSSIVLNRSMLRWRARSDR